MISKMKFVTLTGPREDFDRVVKQYLNRYDIHLENALSELRGVPNLSPFIETNPYKGKASKLKEYITLTQMEGDTSERLLEPLEALEIFSNVMETVGDLRDKKEALTKKKEKQQELLSMIVPFRHLNYSLHSILHFKFIKYRFGRIAHEYYNQFKKYTAQNHNTICFECDRDQDFVWVVYFVPTGTHIKLDAIYSSLHFERTFIPDDYNGTPEEACSSIEKKIAEIDSQLAEVDRNVQKMLYEKSADITSAYHTFYNLDRNFDVRRMAACTRREKKQIYYILCGWIDQEDVPAFEKEIGHDSKVFYLLDDEHPHLDTRPPTKLKNAGIFKPFEMFINMYSLPDYDEIDPTKFVALTYALMFGIMFGDVGQGLLLVLGGLFFYKKKKMSLGAILSFSGCFSTIFGFLYGSVFGYEHVLPTLWMKPMENIMPTLLLAVSFGVGLILTAIIINIINAVKAKDYGRLFFDTNGIAGLIFYGCVIGAVLLMVTGKKTAGIGILGVFIGLPLILIFLKEPLTHLIEKKASIFPDQKVMFFVEAFFELFEIVLSYITNTISFVRIGAFALSHAGMMEVVMMLGKATSGTPNYVVIVLGNLLVMGLEGLIVGIQVLRLEYYEMFSRFYKGNGRKFVPYRQKDATP